MTEEVKNEGRMEEGERKITMTTIMREIKLLELQNGDGNSIYNIICKKGNLDVVDWILENEIKNWKDMKNQLAIKEDKKDLLILKLCSRQRLPSENTIAFIEGCIRDFKAINSYPEENLINIIVRLTWPGRLEIIEKMLNSKTLDDLIQRTKIFHETFKVQKTTAYCTICKKNGHKTAKCWNKDKKKNES
jgi:hypothetical protein